MVAARCPQWCTHASFEPIDDCRSAYDRLRARGVEFTQEPVERYGSVDAGFRDPSGNGWKMIEARGR